MANNIQTILISGLSEQTTADDTDYMVIGGIDAKKIRWKNIWTLIREKLGIGDASELETASKEVVGAINELNTNTKNVYTLADSTKVYANATRGTYNYKSVPNMSKYLLLIVHADIGNTSVRLTFFNNDPNAQYISDQLGTPYIRGGILCDWANERIGVRFIEVNNFTYENVSIGSVTGLLPLA